LSAFAARRTLNVERTKKSDSGEETLGSNIELKDASTPVTAEAALNGDGITRGSHAISSATQTSNLEIEVEDSETGPGSLESDGDDDTSYVIHIDLWRTQLSNHFTVPHHVPSLLKCFSRHRQYLYHLSSQAKPI
jgi:hypothetical protein